MHSRSVTVLIALAVGILLFKVAMGESGRESLPQSGESNPNDRVAQLEHKLATVESDLLKLRHEFDDYTKPTVLVVPMPRYGVKDARRAVKFVFRDWPGAEIKPLFDVNCLMIRGDKRTCDAIKRLIDLLEPIGSEMKDTEPKERSRGSSPGKVEEFSPLPHPSGMRSEKK
jgi:hypothetical protein